MLTRSLLASAMLTASLSIGVAEAATTFTFEETSTGVVGILSGTLDVTGFTGGFVASGAIAINPIGAQLAAEPTAGIATSIIDVSGPATFGTGGITAPNAYVGTQFFLSGTVLFVDSSFSGGAVDGLMTFSGATFASLGLTTGGFEYVLDNDDTFTVQVGSAVSAVPLPAGSLLLLSGLGGVAALKRRKRRAAQLNIA